MTCASWPTASWPTGARAEALRFLIHFVADVHQPLHAEDNDDRGGNDVRVYAGRASAPTCISIWDADVVEALGCDAGAIAGRHRARSLAGAAQGLAGGHARRTGPMRPMPSRATRSIRR